MTGDPDESEQDGEISTSTSCLTQRNRAIADVIRSGLKALNQTALDIQNDRRTKKSLFREQETLTAKEHRAVARETRILRTAQECVLELAQGKGILKIKGESLVLLDLKMTSHRTATLYWSLPASVLMDDHMPKMEKQYWEFKLNQQIEEQGAGTALAVAVHNRLSQSYGYPPRIRLEPASDNQVMELMQRYAQSNRELEEAEREAE